MKMIKRAAFAAHLKERKELTGETGLQLICNERSCQWMTDGDAGATWMDEIHQRPADALRIMRTILGDEAGAAYSARLIF